MTATKEKPAFWEEDWLNIPMGELDIRTMSPERYEAYQYWLVHQADMARIEREQKERAERDTIRAKIEGKTEGKIEIIKELLKEALLPVSSIAKVAHVSEAFVLKIQDEL